MKKWNAHGSLLVGAVIALWILAACAKFVPDSGVKRAAFTSREFGVAVSPRVSRSKFPKRGGGRDMPLKAYTVRGVTYQPVAGPGYVAQGKASWYGQDFHGRRTANGEIFGAYYVTAASPVLPIPSYARVTNLDNGRSIVVRVNDRGPFIAGRVIDLSYQAAEMLGYRQKGGAKVEVRYVGPAPLNVDDHKMLVASLNAPSAVEAPAQESQVAFASAPNGRDPFSGGFLGSVIDLMSYAKPQYSAGDAEAAAAMATRPTLEEWGAAIDESARSVDIDLGVFADPANSERVANAFALLGAVEETPITTAGREAVQLKLTHLRPGAARDDILRLAHELGLGNIVR